MTINYDAPIPLWYPPLTQDDIELAGAFIRKEWNKRMNMVCPKCKSENVEIMPGKGPHYRKLYCISCGYWQWLPKPRREGPPTIAEYVHNNTRQQELI